MNESYARKLRQFMAERASERLQSHRRVVQLEAQLDGAIANRGRAAPGPPAGSAGGGCGATPDAAESFEGGLHVHAAEAEASSSYAHRLALLAAERSREEQRHLEEIARLRTQVRVRVRVRARVRVRVTVRVRVRSSGTSRGGRVRV